MIRFIWVFTLIGFLWVSGCTPLNYRLVEPEKRVDLFDTYSVDPQIPWSGKILRDGILWTIDGANLEQIVFSEAVEDGESFLNDEKAPKFNKEMNVIELSEMLTDSLKIKNWFEIKTSNLKPADLGPFKGFRFDVKMVNANGLPYNGSIAGAIINEKLYLIYYLGVSLHYYPKYINHFNGILNSIQKL